MKTLWNLFLFLALFVVSSCSDDKMLEESGESDVETPEEKPGDTPDIGNMPKLSVVGRYLRNEEGDIVNLHGFAMTFSPFFNQNTWGDYDVDGCMRHNKKQIDGMLSAGWRVNFVRMHLDPYWSDDPALPSVRYEGHERFSESRFRKYLDELFVPMAEYANERGIYVVMRPPGVSPDTIAVGDDYNDFLIKVWDIVSQHPKLKNNKGVMFELANEPINIMTADGSRCGSGEQIFYDQMKIFCQAIVDKIRDNGARNIIWVPGLGYQSQYSGYAINPIEGDNIGYAIHVYPGWYGSDAEKESAEQGGSWGGGYESFQQGWDNSIQPAANIAPIMVTEMDWAPAKYDSTWGKSYTGVAGGYGFGANFKYIVDKCGNVSWLLFAGSHLLIDFKDVPGEEGAYTFLNDPEACPWPVYHWFKEYAGEEIPEGDLESLELVNVNTENEIRMGDACYAAIKAVYADGSSQMVTEKVKFTCDNPDIVTVGELGKISALKQGEATVIASYTSQKDVTKEISFKVRVLNPFLLTMEMFNPSIFGTGSFDEDTHVLITGQWGFGGWEYKSGLDLSGYKSIHVELGNDYADPNFAVSFRLFDENTYWASPAAYDFVNTRKITVDLHNMKDGNGDKLEPSHLYIIGFWSSGKGPIVINSVTLEE